MKLIFSLLIIAYLSKAYEVPNIAYDQRNPICENVQTLLATSSADLIRLSSAVDVLLPTRIARLEVARRYTQRVCKSASKTYTTSESSIGYEGDLRGLCNNALGSMVTLSNQLQSISLSSQKQKDSILNELDGALWSVNKTCKLVSDRLVTASSYASLVQLQKTSSKLKKTQKTNLYSNQASQTANLDEHCQDATRSIDQLSDYLKFLISSVRSTYIENLIPSRMSSLTTYNINCSKIAVTIPAANPPQLIRLADPKTWEYKLGNAVSTIGKFYTTVHLDKDTLIECVANGHARGFPVSGALILRFFVDDMPMGTQIGFNGLDPKIFSFGAFHHQDITGWAPVSFTQMMIVPKGDHVISLKGFTNSAQGGQVNGLEALIKINN